MLLRRECQLLYIFILLSRTCFVLLFLSVYFFFFFFFNDTATTEIYTLSLHDALPIYNRQLPFFRIRARLVFADVNERPNHRSEEHTSELQSQSNLVCRLLLEKKKKKK